MRSASVWIGLVVIVVLTTSGGLIYGRLSNRWTDSQIQVDAGARLEQIPTRVATWEAGATAHLPAYAKTELACSGDTVRQYVDSESGASIGVTLVAGPAGTIAVHSPEICFSSQNYRLLGKRKRIEVRDANGVDHAFWMVDFELQGVEASVVRVYYAWSIGGAWSAPNDARFEFIGSPYLYKVQVAYVSTPTAIETQDPLPSFLQLFLPEAGDELLSAAMSR